MLHCANCAETVLANASIVAVVLSLRLVLACIIGCTGHHRHFHLSQSPTQSHAAVPSSFDRSFWLTALGIGVAVCVMLLGSMALYASRNDAWDQAKQGANNLLLALDRDIERNLTLLDLSVQGVVEALAEPGIDDVSPSLRRHALFDRAATAEDLGSIIVTGKNGEINEESTGKVAITHQPLLADRDYFQVHKQHADAGEFFSRVFASRTGEQDLRFGISRRINGPDGEFAGVVVATLRLNYFRRLFAKLDIGKHGTITLLRSDGRIIYRTPFRREDVDFDLAAKSMNYPRFAASESGQYVAMASLDNVERLFTFRHLGNLPLILTVSLSTDEILEAWQHKAMVIGTAMLLLCTSSVASSLLFRREMVRRARTERALATANEQLSVQASTDGLTGLMNRRAFDDEFDRAFRIAIRQGSTISLLMIDADYFKRFNDTYGHVAGDNVLRALATCLGSTLRRPADRAARYGGEEFVAILPETEKTAALKLGDGVRLAVKQLQIEHSASTIGTLSVSVGVSTTSPLIGDSPAALLKAADVSLYAAKEAGRDCVRYAAEARTSEIDMALVVDAAIRSNDR